MARTGDLLLDTCAAIWMFQGALLEPMALEAMGRANEQRRPLWLSLITAWELGLLAKSGKAAMATSPQAVFEAFLNLPGVQAQPLTAEILIDSSLLPGQIHGDPADRLIVATARANAMPLATRDVGIRKSRVVSLWKGA
jgi:PIN domain nuclease of toxin-antitoxin system